MAVGLVVAAILTALLVDYSLGYACRSRSSWPCRPSDVADGASSDQPVAPPAGAVPISSPTLGTGGGLPAVPPSFLTPQPGLPVGGGLGQTATPTGDLDPLGMQPGVPPAAQPTPSETTIGLTATSVPVPTVAPTPSDDFGVPTTGGPVSTLAPSPATAYPGSSSSRPTSDTGYP